ncbi:MAG: hypothetical protein PHC53_05795 [Patescibacteria group bacterium]|nr:hypothetical protein [Patescibacteria group bacterium]
MKQVPENQEVTKDVVPTREEQLASLREKLAGHQAFGRLRGKLGDSTIYLLGKMIESAESPTSFCRDWDQFAADARVMGNMLAQFRRDGWSAAARALYGALKTDTLIEGETVPLHKTVPITILVLDPERTFSMLRWIRAGYYADLSAYHHRRDHVVQPELVSDLFEKFPSLRKHCDYFSTKFEFYHGDALACAYRDDVRSGYADSLKPFQDKVTRLIMVWESYRNDQLDVVNITFGYIFRAEQSEVLSFFSREEQASLATWQCRLPKVLEERLNRVNVGLHPEAAHDDMVRTQPTLSSAGCSHGFGVRVFPGKENPSEIRAYLRLFNEMNDGYGSVVGVQNTSDRIAFGLRASIEEPDDT